MIYFEKEASARPSRQRIIVAQLGSRMHYAVPSALEEGRILQRLFTDITEASLPGRIARAMPGVIVPNGLRRLLGRKVDGVPPAKVQQFPAFGLRVAGMRKAARFLGDPDGAYIRIGRQFCQRVANEMPSDATGLYSFNGASLELYQSLRGKGVRLFLEQTMAPRLIEDRILDRENGKFPEWRSPNSASRRSRTSLYERESAEWKLADTIVCGSEFVVDGIREAGGPTAKCVVLPYAVDPARFPARIRSTPRDRPLRVLFAGAAGLRKGIQYLYRAAQQLGDSAKFMVIGRTDLPLDTTRLLSSVVNLRGAVPRSMVKGCFDWADVMVLPSLCEGSATVTYEAMASGLPQIVTRSCGSRVEDGVQGLIVESGSAEAISLALRRLTDEVGLLDEMSRNAVAKSSEYTISAYSRRLMKLCSGEGHS